MKFYNYFLVENKSKKCENYFLAERVCFQLKEKEAAHWSGFHHSRFSATAIFPARRVNKQLFVCTTHCVPSLPEHEVDTSPSILVGVVAP